jgi:hypothetical protein
VIAADTSTWVAYLQGDNGEDAQLLDQGLEERRVLMVPVVLTEILSDPEVAIRRESVARGDSAHRAYRRLLATGRRFARQGAGQTPQGPSGRRTDRAVLP